MTTLKVRKPQGNYIQLTLKNPVEVVTSMLLYLKQQARSEERRVGQESRSGWSR